MMFKTLLGPMIVAGLATVAVAAGTRPAHSAAMPIAADKAAAASAVAAPEVVPVYYHRHHRHHHHYYYHH